LCIDRCAIVERKLAQALLCSGTAVQERKEKEIE